MASVPSEVANEDVEGLDCRPVQGWGVKKRFPAGNRGEGGIEKSLKEGEDGGTKALVFRAPEQFLSAIFPNFRSSIEEGDQTFPKAI